MDKMTDKDPKDMTVSELLRLAANGEENEYGYRSPSGKLFCLLLGTDVYTVHTDEGRRSLRSLADKIDAELAEAVRSTGKPMKAVRRIIAAGEDWPAPHEGEGFRKYIERCFLPRPRFADGEPVQFGDATDVGELIGVTFYGRNSGSRAGSVSLVTAENDAVSIDEGHRVERPAPEVLASDGKPLREGDTVWLTDEGAAHAGVCKTRIGAESHGLAGVGPNDRLTVLLPRYEREGHEFVRFDNPNTPWCPASWLTHEEPPTQEQVNELAAKNPCAYFGHTGRDCVGCPAHEEPVIIGSPHCYEVKTLDLLALQRRVIARGGE